MSCEYCNGDSRKSIVDLSNFYDAALYAVINRNCEIEIEYCGIDEHFDCYIPIVFCPMCGARLDGDKS